MAENLAQSDSHVGEHSRDFDLFLPWLLEIASNQHVQEGEDPLPIFDIERIYMDASWSLVMQGYLRPGPRVITGDVRDGYGKGFSLTVKGLQRMESLLKQTAVTAQ